jgi:hypothetical protein
MQGTDLLVLKNYFMARGQNGKPEGKNKSVSAGMPAHFSPESLNDDRRQSKKITNEDEKHIGKVRLRHPNRNVGKTHPAGWGRYREE